MNKTNVVTIEEGLKKELNNYALQARIGIGKKARDVLLEEANNSIDKFYKHYVPDPKKRQYKRTYGLKNHGFAGLYKNPHNKKIVGGVKVTDDKMPKVYKSVVTGDPVSTDWIMFLALNGYHGYMEALVGDAPFVPPVMTPSPYELIDDRRQEFIDNIEDYFSNIIKEISMSDFKYLT